MSDLVKALFVFLAVYYAAEVIWKVYSSPMLLLIGVVFVFLASSKFYEFYLEKWSEKNIRGFGL